jgi:hypothetical protein
MGGAQHGWRCQQLLVACAWQVMGPAWSFFAFLLGDRCVSMASRHSTTAQQLAGLRWFMWRMSSRMCWECLCWPHVGVVCAGDSTSAVMAPPYSTTVTTNLWAVYCNRYGPAVVTAQHSGCAVHCHRWYRLLEGGKAALQALHPMPHPSGPSLVPDAATHPGAPPTWHRHAAASGLHTAASPAPQQAAPMKCSAVMIIPACVLPARPYWLSQHPVLPAKR